MNVSGVIGKRATLTEEGHLAPGEDIDRDVEIVGYNELEDDLYLCCLLSDGTLYWLIHTDVIINTPAR